MNIIIFSAPWCSQCKITKPALLKAAKETEQKVKDINCDDDESKEFIDKYKIYNLPTILIIKDGKEVYRGTGILSEESLKNEIIKNK